MYAVLIIYLLVPACLPQPQSELHATNQTTDTNPTDLSRSQNESFNRQKYENQYVTTHRQNIFGTPYLPPQITSISPLESSKGTTTEYVPIVADYPLSDGKPVSTFNFDDYSDNIFFPDSKSNSSNEHLGTSGGKDEIGDGKESADKQMNTVIVDPNWKPQPDIKDRNERLLWQASVFSKQEEPFLRICGASMVKMTFLISAAHCFWKEGEGLLPASLFAVGAGEVLTYRLDDFGSYRQQNDVGTIKVPPTFIGATHHDIAVVQLTTPFYNSRGMRPVCISFDKQLEKDQLTPGNIATTLGVGIQQKGKLTLLQTLKVPYVSWDECQKTLENTLQYTAEDTMCAGFNSGLRPVLGQICTRDPGAGLAFYLGDNQDLTKGIAIPFLRGVASRSRPCDAPQLTLYTNLRSHREFLEGNIKGLVEECGKYYPQLGALLAKEYGETQFVCDCYC